MHHDLTDFLNAVRWTVFALALIMTVWGLISPKSVSARGWPPIKRPVIALNGIMIMTVAFMGIWESGGVRSWFPKKKWEPPVVTLAPDQVKEETVSFCRLLMSLDEDSAKAARKVVAAFKAGDAMRVYVCVRNMTDAGLPDVEVPAGMPKAVADKLGEAAHAVVQAVSNRRFAAREMAMEMDCAQKVKVIDAESVMRGQTDRQAREYAPDGMKGQADRHAQGYSLDEWMHPKNGNHRETADIYAKRATEEVAAAAAAITEALRAAGVTDAEIDQRAKKDGRIAEEKEIDK